jgi:dUTP pyrophosphatase
MSEFGTWENNMKVALLTDTAKAPTSKFSTDAGADLYADERVVIPAHSMQVVRTGVTVELPANTMGLVYPKSRNNHLIGGGIIDQTYQGEIYVKVINTNSSSLIISQGEAIAQIIVVPILTPEIELVSLDTIHNKITERGKTGGIVSLIEDYIYLGLSTLEEVE